MIYGWGTDHRTKQLDESTVAVCRFKYVSLAFIFSFVWQRRWFLQGRDRAMDREVTADEIEAVYGPGSAPSPGVWKRFGGFITVGAFLVYALVFSAVGSLIGDDDETLAAGDEAVAEFAGDLSSEEVAEPAADQDLDQPATDEPISGEPEPDDDVADDPAAEDPGDETATESGSAVDALGVVTLVGDSNLISVDMGDLVDEYGELTIDGIYATKGIYYSAGVGMIHRSGEIEAADQSKLVVVDYQMLFTSDIGNFSSEAFRLIDDSGRIYDPLVDFHSMVWAGSLYNEHVVFEVPADLMTFTFQGGALDSMRDGFQAQWEVELQPGDISSVLPDESPVVEGPATFERITESEVGNGSLRLLDDVASLTILDAVVQERVDGDAPDLGFKWLLVDVQIIGVDRGLIGNEAFRVGADNEWFPEPRQINDDIQVGGVWSGLLMFEIPVAATEAVFEFGTPAHWESGERTQYRLTLP